MLPHPVIKMSHTIVYPRSIRSYQILMNARERHVRHETSRISGGLIVVQPSMYTPSILKCVRYEHESSSPQVVSGEVWDWNRLSCAIMNTSKVISRSSRAHHNNGAQARPRLLLSPWPISRRYRYPRRECGPRRSSHHHPKQSPGHQSLVYNDGC